MSRWFGSARRVLRSAVFAVLLVAGVGTLDIGSAAPVITTINPGNVASTMAIPPPTDVEVTLTLQVIPTACTADIVWVAPPEPTVTGYEIRRTGPAPEDLGFVNTTNYTDSDVPLGILGNVHGWEVRTMIGSWGSDWVTATPTTFVAIPLLCLPS